MADDDFNKIIDFTIFHETSGDPNGAPHKDPSDPGGSTRWGLAQRYNADIDVMTMTREQAIARYRSKYWDYYACAQLDWPLSGAFFESCVNPGVNYARAWRSSSRNIHEFLLLRAEHYRERAESSANRLKYFHGWIDRVLDFFVKFTGD